MENTIEIVGEILGNKADIDFITLVARNFGWTAQVPNPDVAGETMANTETVEECVGRNIAMYITQLAVNQKKADNEKAIEEAMEAIRLTQQEEIDALQN